MHSCSAPDPVVFFECLDGGRNVLQGELKSVLLEVDHSHLVEHNWILRAEFECRSENMQREGEVVGSD